MSKKKWLGILAVILVSIQFMRTDRTNPASSETESLAASSAVPPEIDSLLRRACADCHSDQTSWPWYSGIAPVSWIVADDVHRGRAELNFSKWATYSLEKQSHLLEEIGEVVEQQAMPPWSYRVLHPEARFSDQETAAILHWAKSRRELLAPTSDSQ